MLWLLFLALQATVALLFTLDKFPKYLAFILIPSLMVLVGLTGNEIVLVLNILGLALLFFITEKIAMDVVALLVLGALALSGLVTTEQALAGFSNPAVVTVWAMFILSDGLTRTGIAQRIGAQVLRLAGRSETRIILVIMLSAGFLSAFMNNIGVAALMLPVAVDIAAKTETAPSRILMPLAYGSLLGGLLTLIGTPPNLLVSNSLVGAGFTGFKLFDFLGVGLSVMMAGTLFVAFIGRKLLPNHRVAGTTPKKTGNLLEQYDLLKNIMMMRIPAGSILAGKSLAEIRFGSDLDLNVIALKSQGIIIPGPDATKHLRIGDRLLVQGRLDRFGEAQLWRDLLTGAGDADLSLLFSETVGMMEMQVAPDSRFLDQTMLQANFSAEFQANLIAVKREFQIFASHLSEITTCEGDLLLFHGNRQDLERMANCKDFYNSRSIRIEDLKKDYGIESRMFQVTIPENWALSSQTLAQTRLGEAYGFIVHVIQREGEVKRMVGPEEEIFAGDRLLIQGWREYLEILGAFNQLEIEEATNLDVRQIESQAAVLAEAVLAPRSSLAGKTVRKLNFREKYGLQILAIWRAGHVHVADLPNLSIQFGDALLVYGRRRKLAFLREDPDFMVLTPESEPGVRRRKAPWAAVIMAGVMIPVLFNLVPIAISAMVGATLMVLTRCLTMNQAYRAIEWKAVFLIAGMLPLGIAMEDSGAAAMIAEAMMNSLGAYGPWPVIIGLYLVTAVATTIIPTAALVVMMGPIVIKACTDLGVSPHSGMMAIAMAASASFTSPISHPANILVMGPGGYRFVDYLKLGIPLAIVVMITVFLTLPFLWPL